MSDESDDRSYMGLPASHYAAIGRVAAAWAALEMGVDGAIWLAAGLSEKVGACITSQISGSSRKLDAYLALIDHLGSSKRLRSDVVALAKDVASLAEQRNRIVHDPWVAKGMDTSSALEQTADDLRVTDSSRRGPHRFEVTARKRLRMGFYYVTTEEVERVRTQIDDAYIRFLKLDERFRSEAQSGE